MGPKRIGKFERTGPDAFRTGPGTSTPADIYSRLLELRAAGLTERGNVDIGLSAASKQSRAQRLDELLRGERERLAGRGKNQNADHGSEGPSYSGIMFADVTAANTFNSGANKIYDLKLKTGGKKTLSPVVIQNAIVGDDSADALSVGEKVMVYIDGISPPKILSAGSAAAITTCVRNLFKDSWFN